MTDIYEAFAFLLIIIMICVFSYVAYKLGEDGGRKNGFREGWIAGIEYERQRHSEK